MQALPVLSSLSEKAGQTHPLIKQSVTAVRDPLKVLAAHGWLTPADMADPDLRIDSLIRSQHVVRVIAPDGRAVIVKQPTPEARQSGRTLHRELYVYRLAGWIDVLSKILPTPLVIDEASQLLACECLTLQPNWPDEMAVEPISAPGVATQLGRIMAGWHHATKDVALEVSPAPGILYFIDSMEQALEGRSDSAQTFMRSVAADPELCESLREGARLYQPACLIHGDIRPDNWVVRREQAERTLKVFDWEMSGLGDPAWDIGSVCAEAIIQLIRSGTGITYDAGGWPSLAASTLGDFLSAYVTALGTMGTSDSTLWDRVALLAAARLLHVASEWAEYPYNIDSGGVDRIVAQARHLLRARQQAASALATFVQS